MVVCITIFSWKHCGQRKEGGGARRSWAARTTQPKGRRRGRSGCRGGGCSGGRGGRGGGGACEGQERGRNSTCGRRRQVAAGRTGGGGASVAGMVQGEETGAGSVGGGWGVGGGTAEAEAALRRRMATVREPRARKRRIRG